MVSALPLGGHMGFAEIDGLRIHYRANGGAAGEAGAARGLPVLYIHGTGCDSQVYERHLATIGQQHRAVAIDLPGHGRSEGRGFRGVADYAHYAVELALHLGWKDFVIAGHSLGGGVALAAALYAPERVRAMILIDTGARLRVDPRIIDHARRVATGERLPPFERRMGFAEATPDSIVAAVEAITEQCDPRVVLCDWIADDSCDFISRVGGIKAPALAICGEEDRFTPPKYSEFFRDHLPDCQLEIIRDAGHWTFVEQPEVFDRAVAAFLARLIR